MKLEKKSFRFELLTSFIFISVIPLVVCSLFLIQLFKVKVARDTRVNNQKLVTEVNRHIERLFDQFEFFGKELNRNEIVFEALREKTAALSSEVYRTLYRETKNFRDEAWVELYDAEGLCCFSTGSGTYKRKMETYWGILHKAEHNSGKFVTRKAEASEPEVLFKAARTLDDSEGRVGFLVINFGKREFENILFGTYGGLDGICILDDFLESVFEAGSATGEDIGRVLRTKAMNGEPIPDSIKGKCINIARMKNADIYTVSLWPEAFSRDTLKSMYSVLFVMIAGLLAVCIILAFSLSGKLSLPIKKLNETMSEVQQGNLDARAQTDWFTEELVELSEKFNEMTFELKNQMETQVEQQKILNEIQIAMMQAQLNPHFLYNTLDTVKWVAKANHVPEIVVLVSKLAKILRASISKNQFSTLADEIELVESYAEIQKIRFNGKFECVCDYGEELALCKIPKLIIQPIVENSVIHGFEECEEGHIFVHSEKKNENGVEKLVVTVLDDGRGINVETLKKIKNGELQKKSGAGHIGIGNVDKIIKLHYGEEFGLKVECPEEGGTVVTLEFPFSMEDKSDA